MGIEFNNCKMVRNWLQGRTCWQQNNWSWGEIVLEFFKKLYIFVHASGLKSTVRRMYLLIKRTARVSKSGVPKKCDLCTTCHTHISVDNVWLGTPLEAANDCSGRSTGYPPLLLKLLALFGVGGTGGRQFLVSLSGHWEEPDDLEAQSSGNQLAFSSAKCKARQLEICKIFCHRLGFH